MSRSRLTNKLEQQSKQTLVISALGCIGIIAFLIFFGIPLLSRLSTVVQNDKEAATTTTDETFIAAPILDTVPSATNSAYTRVTGNAGGNLLIRLYINDTFSDDVESKEDGSFTFKRVELKEGKNEIKALARTQSKKESTFSQTETITYISKAPKLTIDSPSGDPTVKESTFIVKGTSDPNTQVSVNDRWALVDAEGSFSYTLQLANGENMLKIVSTDDAGNTTEVSRKVTYTP